MSSNCANLQDPGGLGAAEGEEVSPGTVGAIVGAVGISVGDTVGLEVGATSLMHAMEVEPRWC